ncbi:MAG: sigma-70 family RNA polymerase sigma factor [Planctomycetota bacterium]
MDTTSISLLQRLRQSDENAAWERFVKIYSPLIFHWGKRNGLTATDSADLVQDVMAFLVTRLPEFEYDSNQRFRGWLRTVVVNKARDRHRRNGVRPKSADHSDQFEHISVESDADLFEEEQYRKFVVQRAKQLIESDFDPISWQACWMAVTDGRSAGEVGRELGMTANAVRVSKSRVLRRLREELDGLLD